MMWIATSSINLGRPPASSTQLCFGDQSSLPFASFTSRRSTNSPMTSSSDRQFYHLRIGLIDLKLAGTARVKRRTDEGLKALRVGNHEDVTYGNRGAVKIDAPTAAVRERIAPPGLRCCLREAVQLSQAGRPLTGVLHRELS